jgi:predicted nucleotidyltransferase
MELADELTVDDTVLRGFCRRHGIRSLRLFGSGARNELRDDSDVDLLVEFQPDPTPGLFGIARLELELRELLGREVDLRTAGDLSPYVRVEVVATARVLYDAA